MRDTLLSCSGKFLVSYNDCPEIRELCDKPNIYVEEISRINNLAQRYEGGCQYAELFISNYDTREFLNSCVQMSLFKEYTNQLIGERNIIYDRINEIHSCTTGNI